MEEDCKCRLKRGTLPMKLTPQKLLKSIATTDSPVARGFGRLIMYYRLNDREEDARLLEALFTMHMRQFQDYRQGSFLEFDRKVQQKRS